VALMPLRPFGSRLNRAFLNNERNNAIYGAYQIEYIGVWRGVQVDQVVRNVATTLVEKVSDVQVGITQYIEDMTQ
mgnify:CR=1